MISLIGWQKLVKFFFFLFSNMVGCRSPLSPWKSVKKSPASQAKPLLSWTCSPSSSKPAAGGWSRDKGEKLKQKLQVRQS